LRTIGAPEATQVRRDGAEPVRDEEWNLLLKENCKRDVIGYKCRESPGPIIDDALIPPDYEEASGRWEVKYKGWYEKENKYVNFNHPYVKWLIDKKGIGTFNLNLNIKYNTSQEVVNKELSKFGILDHFRCYESQKKCSVYLEITDFEIIKELFSYSFIEDIHIGHIVSDYKLNVSLEEMKKCNVDEDCQRVGTDCCSGANCNFESINKKYVDLWNTQIYCHGIACIASICFLVKLSCILRNAWNFRSSYLACSSPCLTSSRCRTLRV